MAKHKGKKRGYIPSSQKSSPQGIDYNSLKNSILDFQGQVNKSLQTLNERINKLEMDVGNCYDLIEGLTGTIKKDAPSQSKLSEFSKVALEADFHSLDAEMKVNALVQYLEKAFTFNETTYTQMIHAAFDRRNGLVNLPETEAPRKEDMALIMWRFTDAEGKNVGVNKPTVYRIGSNDLLIDDEILTMKRGDSRDFNIRFPSNHRFAGVAGKEGKLTVGVLGFKRKTQATGQSAQEMAKNLSQEQKKKVWKEHYPAQTIE